MRDALEARKVWGYPRATLLPLPMVLLSAGSGLDALVVSCAWLAPVCESPPIVAAAVRRSYSVNHIVNRCGEISVQLLDQEGLELFSTCIEERSIAWLEANVQDFWVFQGNQIQSPLVGSGKIHHECRLRQCLAFGGSHDLLLLDVVASWYDRSVLDRDGFVDLNGFSYLSFTEGEYRERGRLLGARPDARHYRPEGLQTENDP